jgi:hypothetical protein
MTSTSVGKQSGCDRHNLPLRSKDRQIFVSEPPVVAGGPFLNRGVGSATLGPPATAGGSDPLPVLTKKRREHWPAALSQTDSLRYLKRRLRKPDSIPELVA